MRRTLAVLAAGLLLAPAAQAATKGPVFGLRAAGNPKLGYFVYTVTPGGSKSGAIIVSNSGTAKGTVKLFTADATTGHTSGTVYLTDAKPSKAGSWVTLAQTSLTLAPGQFKRVPFTLHVPAGTQAGQWVGGIVAETSHQVAGKKSTTKASVQIKIRDLTIVAVQANVPGPPVVDFTIGGVKAGGARGFQQVLVHLENTGNVLVKPTGSVTILDSKGATVEQLPFTMDTFLPHTAIDYPVLLKKALAAGTYTASVSLDAAAKHFAATPQLTVSQTDVKQVFTSASPTQLPAASSSSGSSLPWALIAAGAAAVILLLLLLWFLRMRSWRAKAREGGTTFVQSTSAARMAAAEPEPAPVAEPEPERAAAPPIPPVPSEPPPAPRPPEPAPIPAPASHQERPPECIPHHFWEVAYDRGQLSGDAVWRFPHRCRTCGLEVLAADVADASAQADRL